MKRTCLAAAFAGSVLLTSFSVMAGPVADAEARIRAVYASYRTALFTTNQKDVAAAQASVAKLKEGFAALSSAWSASPPPQYSDDKQFARTLDRVEAIIEDARKQVVRADLAAAHDTLEGVRDQLSDMRLRNGISNISDDMNAYHEAMEHVLQGFTGAALDMGALREQAAILHYLAGRIGRQVPADAQGASFEEALRAMRAPVEALLAASRSGDAAGARKALDGLKRPYSLLFLKFG